MALEGLAVSELSHEYDDDFRVVLVTESTRIDVTVTEADCDNLIAALRPEPGDGESDVIDTDAADPFDL